MRPFGQRLPSVVIGPPGPRSRELASRLAAAESPAVGLRRRARALESGSDIAPIVFAFGEGANVTDVDGNRYVDLAAGFGALLLGHSSARIRGAVDAQSDRLWLALGDVYASQPKVDLCERLVTLFPRPGARVLLGSTGADAVTAALKSAVLATGRPGVVACVGAYHGLSHGPLAACGFKASFRQPFLQQLGVPVRFVPFPGSASDLAQALSALNDALGDGSIGAVLVEPVLGRGGCVVPPPAWLPELRAACNRSKALLICDEIWTGLGRSGAVLASVGAGVVPDLICLGKGLGGGLPISACIGSAEVMAGWADHGGATIHTATHFGAPIACAAACAMLDALGAERLAERSREVGTRWMATLRDRTAGKGVREVRGCGLMVGIALEGGATRALGVMDRLLAHGWIVLTGGVEGDVLTLTPPLNIDEGLLSAFADSLSRVL
jgi:4-aminobutyrate aminotransferase/(S)-3-amino-2-methylpropionate transaminase